MQSVLPQQKDDAVDDKKFHIDEIAFTGLEAGVTAESLSPVVAPVCRSWKGGDLDMDRKQRRHWGKRKHLTRRILQQLAGTAIFFASIGGTAFAADIAADAMPTGGHVAQGEAALRDIVTDAAGKHILTIEQTGNRAILDWQTFNVGKDVVVRFQTWGRNAAGDLVADPSAMTLNRVAAASGLSTIAGTITSTGTFLLTNPNGVYFADGATVDAAGIIVSTAALDETTFMKDGQLVFVQDAGAPNAAITVKGTLVAKTVLPEAQEALNGAAINLGGLPLATELRVTESGIALVADGDVIVGTQGRLQATETPQLVRTDAVGEGSGTSDLARAQEGTIFLRADANADDIAADGTAARVQLENANAAQIAAKHVTMQFSPEMIADGIKDYCAGAKTAETLRRNVASDDVNVFQLVNSIAQLQGIGDAAFGDLSSSYALGKDIDAKATATWNVGTNGVAAGFLPLGTASQPFRGTFSGNGHAIYDLFIQRPEENHVGLFSVTKGARVQALSLVDATITGKYNVGGIAGTVQKGTVLTDVTMRKRDGSAREGETVTGTADNVRGEQKVGGLVGSLAESTMERAQNAATVTGAVAVGGLAGSAEDAQMFDSCNTGYTSAQTNLECGQLVGVVTAETEMAGGLVGKLTGNLADDKKTSTSRLGVRTTRAGTYNSGSVHGGTYVGGLVGWLGSAAIRQAYNTNEAWRGSAVLSSETESTAKSPYGCVEGKAYVGGLVGNAVNPARVTENLLSYAYNAGNVQGGTKIGGIAGGLGIKNGKYEDRYTVYVSRIYSGDTHTVLFREEENDASQVHVEQIYRDGEVTGESNVGGLVGIFGNADLRQAYSVSRVQATGENAVCGALVGLRQKGGKFRTGLLGNVGNPLFYVEREDGLPAVGEDKASKQNSAYGYPLQEMTQAETFGWKDMEGVALSADTDRNADWVVTRGETMPLLRAFGKTEYVRPAKPSEEEPSTEPTEPSVEPEAPTKPEEPVTEPTEPSEPEKPIVEPEKPSEPEEPIVGPEEPSEPEEPTVEPEEPSEPEEPTVEPEEPSEPEEPVVEPEEPSEPEEPVVEPEEPSVPEEPAVELEEPSEPEGRSVEPEEPSMPEGPRVEPEASSTPEKPCVVPEIPAVIEIEPSEEPKKPIASNVESEAPRVTTEPVDKPTESELPIVTPEPAEGPIAHEVSETPHVEPPPAKEPAEAETLPVATETRLDAAAQQVYEFAVHDLLPASDARRHEAAFQKDDASMRFLTLAGMVLRLDGVALLGDGTLSMDSPFSAEEKDTQAGIETSRSE